MNYREPLTKNEIRAHAAHYEQTNPAVYCARMPSTTAAVSTVITSGILL